MTHPEGSCRHDGSKTSDTSTCGGPSGRPNHGRGGPDRRAGFTLIEVLAALVVTSAFVAVVLPYAGRMVTHWWVGETSVEAADGWMQAVSRMGDDLAQALPYGLGPDEKMTPAFRAVPEAVSFVRPALGGAEGLETVTYEIRPSATGNALVRRSHRFDPAAFGRAVGGTAATLIDGPFRFRLVEVAHDGTRRRDWSPDDGMPAGVELSVLVIADQPHRAVVVPAAPVFMPIVARAPAVFKTVGAGQPP